VPSRPVAAPSVVPSIITLIPIKGSPDSESVTFPAILPVMPANIFICNKEKNRINRKIEVLFIVASLHQKILQKRVSGAVYKWG
jgi:hypothetical protein